jgi:hypothetical protein
VRAAIFLGSWKPQLFIGSWAAHIDVAQNIKHASSLWHLPLGSLSAEINCIIAYGKAIVAS